MYNIPAQPVTPVNLAELPLAEAVLNTSQVDLIPATHRPVLYRRLVSNYLTLQEEFWALLFGPAVETQRTCAVVQMYPQVNHSGQTLDTHFELNA
ncbi:hypothetical protein LJ737_20935 [Hymenobacter sp. 15J16-1T3B]|uniref:hypothetical protein n=1 Tax=Hymenobacter sp. 15J16-1T3B TaxID=2886941 RepID=UPI001D12768D|nr:hypothetical protein [Hymenobacter sp. 15J16-1T3B]MCC3159720.1 hypothetical protein [Hymenobacter sp. 15J16-1T3B]